MSHASGTARFVTRISGVTNECFVGEGLQLQIIDPRLDDGAIMSTVDSTSYTITDEGGTQISTGTLSYTATLPYFDEDTPGWYANVTAPSTAGKIHGHATITKSAVPGKWHAVMLVRDQT